MMIGMDYLQDFKRYHRKDIDGAKFKIGENVKFKNQIHKVIAVNCVDEDVYEYALENEYWLVWEEELERISK